MQASRCFDQAHASRRFQNGPCDAGHAIALALHEILSCLGRHAWLRRIQVRMSPPIESSSTVRAQPSLGASRCAACTPFAFPPASRCAARCQPCQCGPKPIARARSRPRGPEHLLARTAQDAPVAQLDRAPDYESGGQEFESLRARQQNQLLTVKLLNRMYPENAYGDILGTLAAFRRV